MKISPACRVYILGTALFIALMVCSRHFDDRGGPYFMVSLTVAGIAYLLAIREFFATSIFPRSVVLVGLLLAAGWQVAFLRLAPGADDDIHRYVWDGRLQRLGYNPYLIAPGNPAVKELHTPETRGLNNPDLPSPYPAGAEMFFRAVTTIHESAFALKVSFVLCEFAIIFVLLDVLRFSRQGAHLVLAFAWNPLLAIEVAGSGHIDIVGALLLLVSVAALMHRWRMTAAVASWASDSSEISASCTLAALLEAGSRSRRWDGGNCSGTPVRAISCPGSHSLRLPWYICEQLSL